MKNISLYAIGILLIAILVGGPIAYFYGKHVGKAKEHAVMQAKLNNANMQITTLLAAAQQNKNTIDQQKKEQKELQDRLDATESKLSKKESEYSKDQIAWRNKLNELTHKPECHALEEEICDAAMGY